MSTPRTPDDGRNEKQRAQQARELEMEHERSRQRDQRTREVDEERSRSRKMTPGGTDRADGAVLREDATPRQQIAFEKDEPGFIERMAEERQRPDFIERTRPEDPSDHFGQLTRDNVNPDIPSSKTRIGEIVDPNTLGMDQSQQGVSPPPAENQPEQWPQDQKVPAVSEYDKGEEGQQPKGKAATPREGELPLEPLRTASINEPPGSNVLPGADTGPNQPPEGAELPPLVLTDIDPDSVQIGAMIDFTLTVTGSGFGPNCVILFDDEELPTTLVNTTTLTASPPSQAEPGVVDVEVARGEDLSDVLTFEFTAEEPPARSGERKKPERKPKKSTPISRRADKKQKSKK